jgi:hypothetical protein
LKTEVDQQGNRIYEINRTLTSERRLRHIDFEPIGSQDGGNATLQLVTKGSCSLLDIRRHNA